MLRCRKVENPTTEEALATIANRAPANLTLIVMDNGIYQITGGQPSATGGKADVVALAKGAGITSAEWASDEAQFEILVERALTQMSPAFIAARIDDRPPAGQTEREPSNIRERFMSGLGVRAYSDR